MIAPRRIAFLSVLLGLGVLGTAAAGPGSPVRTVYEVWGKDVRDVATATPENPNPGAWIRLASSDSRAGAEQALITIKRHGGFLYLHIRERLVGPDRPGDGMVRPRVGGVKEIKPKPPAPALPRPKGTGVVRPPVTVLPNVVR